jgi:hypothetical protein
VKKGIVTGLIIGILITSSVAFGADAIRNSYFNPDLKLAINGKPVQDLRIVTVELEGEQYGRNYYSIADLVKALNDFGGVVAKVDFDAGTKTTVIDIEQKTVYITPIPKNSLQREGDVTMNEVPLNKYGHPDFSNVVPNERPKIETDGTYYYFTYNDTKYILVSGGSNEPQLKLPEPYRFEIPIIDGKIHFGIQLIKSDETGREVIIDDIPYAWYYRASSYCIPYDYYVNTIIPIVNKGAE